MGPPVGDRPRALALDLDGTLLGTDSLWELFFKGLSQGRLAPLGWLLCGRLRFKRNLARTVELDLDLLPWNREVIDLALAHRAGGGEVILATAANLAMAERVSARFGFLSGHLASDLEVNLKGAAKARELSGRYGRGGFVYAGDSRADLAVWREAHGAVVVGPPSLARLARPLGGEVRTVRPVGSKRPSLGMVLLIGRLARWPANLPVLLPLALAHALGAGAPGQAPRALLALLGLCCLSSAGHAMDDLLNLEADRRDPARRGGVLASGALDLSRGGFVFLGFLLAGLAAGLLAGQGLILVSGLFVLSSLLRSFPRPSRRPPGAAFRALRLALRLLAGLRALGPLA
ncbi:MAG: haloacid dehalogenase-like hydrolase [Deltaproteobacteria bacterium]|jgi:phosphoserine phosphatase|nr:haloacid dehalogenase-like hydrolase [Deltaproteobacteria bacterium]